MARRDRAIRAHLRDRFVVTMLDGDTFDGLVTDADEATLVVVDAGQLGSKGERIPVDGVLYLPRGRVAYMQRPST